MSRARLEWLRSWPRRGCLAQRERGGAKAGPLSGCSSWPRAAGATPAGVLMPHAPCSPRRVKWQREAHYRAKVPLREPASLSAGIENAEMSKIQFAVKQIYNAA